MPDPSLSVAILTRNRLGLLKRALASLSRQQTVPDEIVVIDTGSTDGTREWLAAEYPARADTADQPTPGGPEASQGSALPHVRWIEDSGEGAYAGARNRAVRATHGDLVAFLDDDCEVDPGWTRRILDRFAADPDLDVLGGVTLPADPLPFPDWWPPEINWVIGLSVPGCWGSDAGRVHLGQTSNLTFRRRSWEAAPFGELGEKDFAHREEVYDAGREDADWWRRLRRLGRRLALDGRLIAWHAIPPSRIRWRQALDRARRDGRSHWRRAGTRADARAAASDIVHAPVRFAELAARRGMPAERAARQVALWSARQAGLLDTAVSQWENPLHPQERARLYASEAVRMAAGVGKWAVRIAVASAHRALRHTRPIPSPGSPPAALLLVSCGYLGDQLLIQPALRLLRAAYPSTRIVLLGNSFAEELYGPAAPEADRGVVNEVVNVDAWDGAPLPRRHVQLRRLVTDLNPGATVVFYAHGLWPAPLFLASSAPVIGFDHDQGFAQRLWPDLMTVCLRKDWTIHEILNHARLARCLGADGEIEPFTITIPDEIERKTRSLLDELGLGSSSEIERSKGKRRGAATGASRPFVALHPGVGQRYKEWPAARWRQVAERIRSETGHDVVFIGGRAARPIVERFQARGLAAHNLCGSLSLRATAALLRHARILVTTDSGPKHLAIAVGAPTLTLYGPSDERRWGDFWHRPIHHELRGGLPDLTLEDLRSLPPNHTLRLLTAADVFRAVSALLQ